MKRKINKVGPGTFTISLPKDWIEKQKLKKSDEIDVEERGNTIVISKSKTLETKKLKAHLPAHNYTIRRFLHHSYKSGADEVELSFDDKECIKIIEANIGNFIGYEIIEQNDNSVVIKSLTEINDKDFEKTFKRFFEITLFFAKKVYENLEEGNFDSLSNTALIEKTQNKLYLYCLRALNIFKERLKDMPTFYYLLLQRLEDIGDSLKFICQHYSKDHPKKISKETLNLMKGINELLVFIHDMYSDFTFEKNPYLFDTHLKLIEKIKILLLSQPREEMFLISELFRITVNLNDAGSPIFAIGVERMGDQKT